MNQSSRQHFFGCVGHDGELHRTYWSSVSNASLT